MKWIPKLDSISCHTRHAVSTAILWEKNSVLFLKQPKRCCLDGSVCAWACLCARVFVYVGCSPWNSRACPEFFTASLQRWWFHHLWWNDSIIIPWWLMEWFHHPSLILFWTTFHTSPFQPDQPLHDREPRNCVPVYGNLLDSTVTATHKRLTV